MTQEALNNWQHLAEQHREKKGLSTRFFDAFEVTGFTLPVGDAEILSRVCAKFPGGVMISIDPAGDCEMFSAGYRENVDGCLALLSKMLYEQVESFYWDEEQKPECKARLKFKREKK